MKYCIEFAHLFSGDVIEVIHIVANFLVRKIYEKLNRTCITGNHRSIQRVKYKELENFLELCFITFI